MNETILKVLPINDLLGQKFYVPSYQRGYRWTTRQVTELLDDIWEFRKKSEQRPKEEFYCLQPVVVAQKDDEWILIDGQQRLTTIYLILSYLDKILAILEKDKYNIRYETRSESEEFLKKIDLEQSNKNIDYFHICQAYTAIKDWFSKKDGNAKINFLTNLLNDDDTGKNVKVIWYEISDDNIPIDIFTRINVGKIPLTNAELIKSLFLGKIKANSNNDKVNLKQIQIASEWDNIEYTLQNDSFWYFIYEGNQTYETRIEYIFDLMKNKHSEDENYFTFHKFNEDFENNDIDTIWLSIKKYFQTFQEWFNNKNLYHLIGYLISTGSSVSELKSASENRNKSQFKEFLIQEIKKQITYNIEDLDYTNKSDRNKKIRPLLLLFNIQTILANENSNIRFPFNRYKTDSWDIEHIRSVKSDKRPKDTNQQKSWITTVLEYFTGKKEFEEQKNVIETLKGKEKELSNEIFELLYNQKLNETSFTIIYEKVLTHFDENTEPENINSISNLALLDSKTNRSYKNAVFPIKRKVIIENDMTGSFIPLCTKNVFLKSYSNKFDNIMFWQINDANDYLSAIKSTLSIFLPQQNEGNNE